MKNRFFLSVSEARKIIDSSVQPGKKVRLHIKDTVGYILYDAVKSRIHTPPFDNSAMDGYAFRFSDFKNNRAIHISGAIAAGEIFKNKINAGTAIRIFTGAPVPKGYDTVVMQEKVTVNDDELIINDELLSKGSNIRLKGTQSRKGKVILEKGHIMSPASIGFLASNGITRVSVYNKPKIAIVITGNELVKPGGKLKPGQIYESNEIALRTALHKAGIHRIKSIHVKDQESQILKIFKRMEKEADFLLFTGGISVGDHDYTASVFEKSGVERVFYKVRQKPGKPLFFGIKKKKYVFGLPGNPVSVLSCFYEFVLPAIKKFQNHAEVNLKELQLPIQNAIEKKSGMTVFYKAKTDFRSVKILPDQESYKMNSFAEANCFVVLDENDTKIKAKSMVNVHLLP